MCLQPQLRFQIIVYYVLYYTRSMVQDRFKNCSYVWCIFLIVKFLHIFLSFVFWVVSVKKDIVSIKSTWYHVTPYYVVVKDTCLWIIFLSFSNRFLPYSLHNKADSFKSEFLSNRIRISQPCKYVSKFSFEKPKNYDKWTH